MVLVQFCFLNGTLADLVKAKGGSVAEWLERRIWNP